MIRGELYRSVQVVPAHEHCLWYLNKHGKWTARKQFADKFTRNESTGKLRSVNRHYRRLIKQIPKNV